MTIRVVMDMVNITNTLEYQLGHTIFYSITGGGGGIYLITQ